MQLGQLGETEIEDLQAAIVRDENIFRFQVAMDDAFVVRGSQTLRDLRRVFHSAPRGQRAIVHFDAKRMSFEKFGDEVRRAVVFANVMNGENVGMIQRSNRASFLLEAPQAVGIFRKCFREDFDGDVAAEARVLRAKHFAHSARANRRDNFVGPYFCAAEEAPLSCRVKLFRRIIQI